jgi:hypothetical protein
MALVVCAGVLLPASAAHAFQRGFTITGWSADAYLSARSDAALTRMAADGSDHAAVFTQWFMDSPTSSSLAPDPQRTPSDAAILHALATARTAGMEVALKPQVGIRTGNWIGYAHPGDSAAFWGDYRTMLLHYADLAEQGGATLLVVGTEMGTLSGDEAHWRPLIAEVRQHFRGQLTYAANYDEFARVPFWDALDYIGIDAYFSLADPSDPAPSADVLTAAWSTRGYLAQIAAVSQRTGKQVLFTEIGYRGVRSTAVHPNQWNEDDEIDVSAQANAYAAFYAAVADQPWMAGAYWWGVESENWWVKDYNPMAKPAEEIMAAWNRRAPTAPAAPSPSPDVGADPTPPEDPQPIGADEPAPPREPDPAPKTDPVITTAPARPVPPAVLASVRGRRLTGAIEHYSPKCHGSLSLRLRARSHGRWRYVRPSHVLMVKDSGRFSRRLRRGPLRVRAVFSSRCGRAASRWISSTR